MVEEQIRYGNLEESGSTISADTFRRIFLLNIVDGFRDGSYGLMRLHKITYIVERERQRKKVFEFRKYKHGQYSETLDVTKDQLISMGYITAVPLETAKVIQFKLAGKTVDVNLGGNIYRIADRTVMDFYRDSFRDISPDLVGVIQEAIDSYGYLAEEQLLRRCYEFPEFVKTNFEDIIFESDLPEQIEVAGLSHDECEELELSLNPRFISAMTKIAEGMEQSTLDMSRVATVDQAL